MKREVAIDGRAAQLEITGEKFRYESEGRVVDGDRLITPIAAGSYSVLIGGRSFDVIAVGDGQVIVNGRAIGVQVFDPRENRGRKTKGAGEGRLEIAAMMPGKVVRVLVAPGDAIEAGQGLIVVEAMKMQNEMKSPKAGRVIEVKAKPDATVAAGEILLIIE